jgi:hypothetical protein
MIESNLEYKLVKKISQKYIVNTFFNKQPLLFQELIRI